MSAAVDTGTATVRRRGRKGKQEDLPGVDQSDRKIQEIEDLGDALADLQDEMSTLKGKVKDADENLVAAMKRRERTYYNRPTWGSVTLKETTTSCKVKKASTGKVDDDSGEEESDE